MTAPEPLLLRRRDFREVLVCTDEEEESIVLTIGRPDCRGGPDEYALTIADAVSLIDRLVHEVAEIRGGTKGGAGPLSSTF
jgi:hypothetical protein